MCEDSEFGTQPGRALSDPAEPTQPAPSLPLCVALPPFYTLPPKFLPTALSTSS